MLFFVIVDAVDVDAVDVDAVVVDGGSSDDDDPSVWKQTVGKIRHTCMWYAKVLRVIAPHRPSNYMNTALSNVYRVFHDLRTLLQEAIS